MKCRPKLRATAPEWGAGLRSYGAKTGKAALTRMIEIQRMAAPGDKDNKKTRSLS